MGIMKGNFNLRALANSGHICGNLMTNKDISTLITYD